MSEPVFDGGEVFVWQESATARRFFAFRTMEAAYEFVLESSGEEAQQSRWKEHLAELVEGAEGSRLGAGIVEAKAGESYAAFAERIQESEAGRLHGVTEPDVIAVVPEGFSVTYK